MRRTLWAPACVVWVVVGLLAAPVLMGAVPGGGALKAPPDFAFERLMVGRPGLERVAALGRQYGARVGIYGGTVRDCFLGRPFSVISDLDLLYDTSEAVWPAFRDAVLAPAPELPPGPSPDFHWDLGEDEAASARLKMYHEEGITATKVGVLLDGTLLDPTGHGVADLRSRTLRYWPPDREWVELENYGRFVRDVARLADFRRDPGTMAMLRRSGERCGDGATEAGRRARAAAAACRRLEPGGTTVTFPGLIGSFRRDLRALHRGLAERTPCFPVDLLVFELFKTVTQAPDMGSMREVFGVLGVGPLLRALGLEAEAALLTDPAVSREALFAAFEFPGHLKRRPSELPGRLGEFAETLRRYTYRSMFDMLASEFPTGAPEAETLRRRRDAFMSASSWNLLRPGEDVVEELSLFLDGEFTLGRLPEAAVMKSLAWFAATYLPLGARLLVPMSGAMPPVSAGALRGLERGWSGEVAAIPRGAPHGMADLGGYLGFQLGEELVGTFTDPATGVAFLRGDEKVARRVLTALGCTRVYACNAPGFRRRKGTVVGWDGARDRLWVAWHDFASDEQLLNHEARVYLSRGPEVDRRREGVVVLRGEENSVPGLDDLVGAVRRLGGPVVLLAVNFVNPLRDMLVDPTPWRFGEMRLTVGRLPGPGRPRYVVGLSGFGACYGSLPARVAERLLPFGLRHVVLVGTAGGLPGEELRRDDWVVPGEVELVETTGARLGASIPMVNAFVECALPGTRTGVRHATIATPLAETRAVVDRLADRHLTSVDCELGHLARVAQTSRGRLTMWAALTVTDVVGEAAADAIDSRNDEGQRQTVTEMLRAVVERVAAERGSAAVAR